MPDLNEEDIKQRAYQLWEEDGRPEGRHVQHYMAAMTQLTAGQGVDTPPAASATSGTADPQADSASPTGSKGKSRAPASRTGTRTKAAARS